jgi:putative ABC transport system permease protein
MMIANIAFRNLLQAKRRTFLMSVAIAIVAALFLLLRAASYSVGERLVSSATTLSAGHVNISGFIKPRQKYAAPLISDRDHIRQLVSKAVPEAVTVIDRHRGWGRAISRASSINTAINGINAKEEGRFFKNLTLAKEKEYRKDGSDRVYGNLEDLNKPKTVLIFASQAKRLDLQIGDTMTVVTESAGRPANTVDLQVVAIASDFGFLSSWSIFTQREVVLDLYQLSSGTTGAVMLYLSSIEDAGPVMERLRKVLSHEGLDVMDHDPRPFFQKLDKVYGEDWLGEKIDLTIWSDEISYVLWIKRVLDFVSYIIISILAAIIIGGIVNSMWMSVRERTKEIGTMRAIGAQRGFIMQLFVIEGLFLGLFASALGVLGSALAIVIINSLEIPIMNDGIRMFLMADTLHLRLTLMQMLTTLLLFACMTALAALIPAIKAARLRPVVALMNVKE